MGIDLSKISGQAAGIPTTPQQGINVYDQGMKQDQNIDVQKNLEIQQAEQNLEAQTMFDQQQEKDVISRDQQFQDNLLKLQGLNYSKEAFGVKPSDIARGEGERLANSLYSGVGQVIGQVGDAFTFLQSMTPGSKYWLPFNDPIGDYFREAGEGMMKDYKNTYIPSEINDFSWNSLANPTFWTGEVAQQLPNWLSMLVPGYAGSNMAKNVILRMGKRRMLKGGLGSAGTGVLIEKGKLAGQVLRKTKGKSLLGTSSLFTKVAKKGTKGYKVDDLMLSDGIGKTYASLVGAGIGTTAVDGAMIAGQTYNSVLAETGDADAASKAAAYTFLDNSKWLAVNSLSWGMTFGSLPGSAAQRILNRQLISGAQSFAAKATNFSFKAIKNIVPRASFEAIEEMYQESYQDWVQKKRMFRAKGEKWDYDDSFDGYLRYFDSAENQRTKMVSFATGLFGGTFAGSLNTMASRQSALDQQQELFEKLYKEINGTDQAERLMAIDSIVQSSVENGETSSLLGFIAELEKDGKISPELKSLYNEVIENYQSIYDRVPDFLKLISPEGAGIYYNNLTQVERNKQAIKEVEENFERNSENAKKQYGGKKAEQLIKEYREQADIEIEQINTEIENIAEKNLQIERTILSKNKNYKAGTRVTQDGKLTTEKKPGTKAKTGFVGRTLTEEERDTILRKPEEERTEQEKEQLSLAERVGYGIGYTAAAAKKAGKGVVRFARKEPRIAGGAAVGAGIGAAIGGPVGAVLGGAAGAGIAALTGQQQTGAEIEEVKEGAKQEVEQEVEKETEISDTNVLREQAIERIKKQKGENAVISEEEIKNEIKEIQKEDRLGRTITGADEAKVGKEKVVVTEKYAEKYADLRKRKEVLDDKSRRSKKEDKELAEINAELQNYDESAIVDKIVEEEKSGKKLSASYKAAKNYLSDKVKKKEPPVVKKKVKPVNPTSSEPQEEERKAKLSQTELYELPADEQAVIAKLSLSWDKKLPKGAYIAMMSELTAKQKNVAAFNIGGAMFVRPNAIFQEAFIHEYAHIYKRIYKDLPLLKAFDRELIANKSLWLNVQAMYPEITKYKFYGKDVEIQKILRRINQQKNHKRSIFRNPKTPELQSLVFKAEEMYDKFNSGMYLNSEGQRLLRDDYRDFMDALDAAGYKKTADAKQDALLEEAFATYIANPRDAKSRARAREIFDDLFINKKEVDKRNNIAKRFWNVIGGWGKTNKKDIQELTQTSNPNFADLTLDQLRDEMVNQQMGINDPTAELVSTINEIREFKMPDAISNHEDRIERLRNEIERTKDRSKKAKLQKVLDKAENSLEAMRVAAESQGVTIESLKDSGERLSVKVAEVYKGVMSSIEDELKQKRSTIIKTLLTADNKEEALNIIARNLIQDNASKTGVYHDVIQYMKHSDNEARMIENVRTLIQIKVLANSKQSNKIINDILNESVSLEVKRLKNKLGETEFEETREILVEMFQNIEDQLRENSVEGAITVQESTNVLNKNHDLFTDSISKFVKQFVNELYTGNIAEGRQLRELYKDSKTPYMKTIGKRVFMDLYKFSNIYNKDFGAFISEIRSAENTHPETQVFVRWMDKKFSVAGGNLFNVAHSNKMLYYIYKSYKNKIHERIFSTAVDTQTPTALSDFQLFNDDNMAFEEAGLIDAVMSSVNELYNKNSKYYDRGTNLRNQITNKAESIRTNLKNGVRQDEELVDFMKTFFSSFPHGYVTFEYLMQNGVTQNNKKFTLAEFFEANYNKVFTKKGVNPEIFRPAITQAMEYSRFDNYLTVVDNPEGNPTNTMNTTSYIHKKNKRLNDLFYKMEDESIESYEQRIVDNIKEQIYTKGKKQYTNEFLPIKLFKDKDGNTTYEFVPNTIKFRGGVLDVHRKAGLNYVRLNSAELQVSDLTDFVKAFNTPDTRSADGRLQKAQYYQPIVVAAEKTRQYYILAPVLRGRDSDKARGYLSQLASETYRDGSPIIPILNKTGSFNNSVINQEIEAIKDHMSNNIHLYKNNIDFRQFVDNKGRLIDSKLNPMLRSYVISHALNKAQAQMIFAPHSIYKSENDYTKRATGIIARHISLDKDVESIVLDNVYQMEDGSFMNEKEYLQLPEEQQTGQLMTDASSFITEDTSQMLQEEYGLTFMRNDREASKHWKGVYFGQDLRDKGDRLENELGRKGIYLKSNWFVITNGMRDPESPTYNPYFARVAELMERREAFIRQNNPDANFITIASNKKAVPTYALEDDVTLDEQGNINWYHSVDLSESIDAAFEKLNFAQQQLMEDNGGFKGLDGTNFGIQLILDKDKSMSPVPTQSISHHLTNATPETQEIIDEAHKDFADALNNQFSLRAEDYLKISAVDNVQDLQKLNQQLKDRILSDWAGSLKANLSQYASAYFPMINYMRNSILNKDLVLSGTKMVAPGTIAFQMTDVGYNLKSYTGLNFFVSEDSTYDQSAKNKIQKAIDKYGNINVSEVILPDNMKGRYRVGDIVLGSRIPSHGKASQPVLIIKGFHDSSAGSAITLPSKVTNVMGADYDGDAIYVQAYYTKTNQPYQAAYNRFFDNIVKLNGSTQHAEEVSKAIDIDSINNDVVPEVEQILKVDEAYNSSQMLPMGHLKAFQENVPSRGMIGIAANMTRDINYFAALDIGLKFNVTVETYDGQKIVMDGFDDTKNPDTWFNVAQVLNVVIDNPKHQTANRLGLTYNTIKPYIQLLRMGVSFKDIALIMRSEGAKKYNKYAAEMSVIHKDESKYYSPGYKAMLEILAGKEGALRQVKGKDANDIILNSSEFRNNAASVTRQINDRLNVKLDGSGSLFIDVRNTLEGGDLSQIEVVRLLEALNKSGQEIFDVGRMIGAYALTIQNGFQAQKIIDDFNNVGNQQSSFTNTIGLRTNPVIVQNEKVLREIVSLDETTNLQYSNKSKQLNEHLDKLIQDKNLFSRSATSVRNFVKYRMLNELSILNGMPGEQELYQILDAEMFDQMEKPIEERNKFFLDGIVLTNGKLRLNNKMFDSLSHTSDIEMIQQDFAKLSPFIKESIIQLDFLQNGWLSSNSVSPLFHPDVFTKNYEDGGFNINAELDNMLSTGREEYTTEELNQLGADFLSEYSYSAPIVRERPQERKDGEYFIKGTYFTKELQTTDEQFGTPHVVKYWDKNQKQYLVFKYNPNSTYYSLIGETKPSEPGQEEQHNKTVVKKSRKDLNRQRRINDVFGPIVKEAKLGDVEVVMEDRTLGDKPLEKQEYLKLKGVNLSRLRNNAAAETFYDNQYQRYVEDWKVGRIEYEKNIVTQEYKNMTDAQLIELSLDNKGADALVRNVLNYYYDVELAVRSEKQQLDTIMDVAKKNNIDITNNDLGVVESWLISNNLKQTSADLQGVVNQIEKQTNMFVKEWRDAAIGIKQLAQAVKRERLSGMSFGEKTSLALSGGLENYIYAPMIVRVRLNNGRTYLRLKSIEESRGLTDTQRAFLTAFRSTVQRFYPTADETSLPHKMIGGIEALRKNGIMGLYRLSAGSTSNIGNIKVRGERPDGRIDILPYKQWIDIYEEGRRGFAIEDIQNIKRLDGLRKRAIRAAKLGRHDDGEIIYLNKFDRQAMYEDSTFYQFIDSKNASMSDMGSIDLEDIFLAFTHAEMFKKGSRLSIDQYLASVPEGDRDLIDYNSWARDNNINEFMGMEQLEPLIDGTILLNKARGNKNAVRYLQEVWKEGYLGGKTQKTFNSFWEWIIDKIVKLTSFGILGFNVAIGFGNVTMGKYQALRSKGGKQFIKGEERFWKGWVGQDFGERINQSGREKSLEAVSRNKTAAMLNELLKFEFYQWEKVSSIYKQNSIMRLAFMPLDLSEKWIQGSMFLGMLTEKQYNAYDVDQDGNLIVVDETNALSDAQLRMLINEVKKQQGFGYSPMDQRRLQLYSWGRALLQFKRYFITLFRERWGGEYVDRFGNPEIGSYTGSIKFLQDVMEGKKKMSDYETLPKYQKDAIRRHLNGVGIFFMGIMLLGIAGDEDDPYSRKVTKETKKFLNNQNAMFIPSRVQFMAQPPVYSFWRSKLKPSGRKKDKEPQREVEYRVR